MRLVKQRPLRNMPKELIASTMITSPGQFLRNRRVDPLSDMEAWKWFNNIGEVHFGISSGARECSRATLKAVRWDDADTPVDATGFPADVVMAIQSPNGGQSQVISSFYANRKVTGDGYLLGYPTDEDPTYLWFDFLSPDELVPDGARAPANERIRRQRTPIANGSTADIDIYNLSDVILSRIWTPHPQFSGIPDSPLKALHAVCEELYILTMSLKAKITSRLATAGFLIFPASVANSAPIPPPAADATKFSENEFINWVITQMTQTIIDPSVPAASVPFVFTVPDQSVDLIKWIRVEAEVFETDIKQRAELIGRVLAGLDLRPEQVQGFSDSNHWSAWSTQDVHLKVDVSPEIEALCWALTKDYLWPQMRAERDAENAGNLDNRRNWTEDEIRRHAVWYDLGNLTVRPNKADSYVVLHDHLAVGPEALREATGATEAEAPTEIEYIRQAGLIAKNIYAMTYKLPEAENIDWDRLMAVGGVERPGGAQAPGTPVEAPSGPGKQPPGPKPSQSDKPKSQQPQ